MMILAILVGSILALKAFSQAGAQTAASVSPAARSNMIVAGQKDVAPVETEFTGFPVPEVLPTTNRATVTDYSVNLASAFNIYSNLRKAGEFGSAPTFGTPLTLAASTPGGGAGGGGFGGSGGGRGTK